MIKKLLAILICVLMVVTLSACDKGDTSSNYSKLESQDVTSGQETGDSSNNQNNESADINSTTSLYGVWVAKRDITEAVEKFMARVYPESVVVVETVTVDYVATFTKDKNCSFVMNAANIFYDVVLKTVEKHIRSLTSDSTTINLQIAQFKSNYKKETVTKTMNSKQEGKFTVRGDINSSGTVIITGENIDSTLRFSIDGTELTLIPVREGKPVEDEKMIFVKQ